MQNSLIKNTSILIFFFITGFSWGRSLASYLEPLGSRGDLFPIMVALLFSSVFLHHEALRSKIDRLPNWLFPVFAPLLMVAFLIWY